MINPLTPVVVNNVRPLISIINHHFILNIFYFPSYDYLEIGDVGKFCGSTLPPITDMKTEALTLTFKSDHRITYKGFKLNYKLTGINDNLCLLVFRCKNLLIST